MLTLVADNLPRFMTCNGSVNMPSHQPFNVNDETRNEGIAAHWLIEQAHKGRFSPEELIDRKAENGVFITAEMVEHVTPYLDAIKGRGEVECVTSYGDQHFQINGRADWVGYTNHTLYVSDFKYGWGIIEPQDNWTLISHAVGWIFKNPNLSVEEITFAIFQPRPHHPLGKIRNHTITFEELWQKWQILHNALLNPTNTLQTSGHCKRCPALASCPAALQAGMNAIDVSEIAYVADVDNEALSAILSNIEVAIKHLENSKKAYGEMALHRIKAGQIIRNYGIERELTNKQWKEGITVETAQLLTGKNIAKNQLMTPAQALKAGVSQEAIDALTERREKGVKLVRIDADTAARKILTIK